MKKKCVFCFLSIIVFLSGCASNTALKDVPSEIDLAYEQFVSNDANAQASNPSEDLENEWRIRMSEAMESMDKIKETDIIVDDDGKTITITIEVLDHETLTETEVLQIKQLVQGSLEKEYEVVITVL